MSEAVPEVLVNEHEMLNNRLAVTDDEAVQERAKAVKDHTPKPTVAEAIAEGRKVAHDINQWQVRGDNRVFIPSGRTVPSIPPGNYWINHNDAVGVFLESRRIINDGIITMPDSASARVLKHMEKFWNSYARYKKFGLLYKRGILLWGPPGSGKTITVLQLCQQIIDRGGIVLHTAQPSMTATMLTFIRDIEPVRPIICIYEDVDEIIRNYGESALLSLLDGETQIENIVHIATTNYPERLGARIVNRPSRFDDRVLVDMPTGEQRTAYLRRMMPEEPLKFIAKWVNDTQGFSIAHLRELVAAVYCLDSDYDETLTRLKSMNIAPTGMDGFAKKAEMGFALRGVASQGACSAG